MWGQIERPDIGMIKRLYLEGGGAAPTLDVLELRNGQVLALDTEGACLYESVEAFRQGNEALDYLAFECSWHVPTYSPHCGVMVCGRCGWHAGLVRCYCGWAANGGDGRQQLIDLGEVID